MRDTGWGPLKRRQLASSRGAFPDDAAEKQYEARLTGGCKGCWQYVARCGWDGIAWCPCTAREYLSARTRATRHWNRFPNAHECAAGPVALCTWSRSLQI